MAKLFDTRLFKRLVSTSKSRGKDEAERQKQTRIASCALLIEMAKSDNDFAESERAKIISIIRDTFKLDEFEIEDLIFLSEQKLADENAMKEITNYIKEHFLLDEKLDLVKNLWRIIYNDDDLHSHEQAMIKQITALLEIDNRMVTAAKEDVQREMGLYR